VSLKRYDEAMQHSFVMKDLKKYKGMHGLMQAYDSSLLFDKLPRAVNKAAYTMFSVDGVSKAAKQKQAVQIMKEATGGTLQAVRLGIRGWRAMNG
jgi:electron transfer flavoprotein-quinone oxidoreductase